MRDLAGYLQRRWQAGLFRRVRTLYTDGRRVCSDDGSWLTPFCSNDYLGLAGEPRVAEAVASAARSHGAGSGAAHLVSGHRPAHEYLEREPAAFLGRERALLFSTGYMANMGVIAALAGKGDTIFSDELNHASIIDGCKLSRARIRTYRHRDTDDLEQQLAETEGHKLVVTDGVFSMDGDMAPLRRLSELCAEHDALLIVDDAHGFGTMGDTGAGTGEHFQVQDDIDVYFATFAKSMAGIGSFVASKQYIVNYLRYNMRSQTFAKSLPMPMVIGAIKRLELLKNKPELREKLWTIVNALQKGLKEAGFNLGNTESPVTPVYLSGSVPEGTNIIMDLRENYNIFCSLVAYPVIPKGELLIRLIPTAAHTLEDVNYTIRAFKEVHQKLENGDYQSDNIAKVS